MPGLAQRNDQFTNASSGVVYSVSSADGFWSKHRGDVSNNQLQKFWSDLSPQARQELLRIDKQSLFEQARKNMYCSRCNGLLLEGFLQIVMYGKSLQQEGAGGNFLGNRSGCQNDSGSCEDEIQDSSVHPWGGLSTTRDGSLTLLDCFLYSKSLREVQNVFDSARARERERELLYPDACGGGGRGWISQVMASYGRGHGTRETCALHTARLSCDTLVDFWSALGEETRQSLLRMKEEDFIERLMYRFDSKRFCRDCRRNVIREFKELKELKRMRREPRCTIWFCVADTAFQCEVSDDTVQVDWCQTFTDTVGIYHHFEWAVGTGEGKSDILEFENVGMNGSVQVDGLDLGSLSACFITLRAWKLDGRCTELSVKAHALKGQQCVHSRLVVGDGFVTITRGDSINSFFEHAEEAEEEEDDDSMDKDGNELDGECSRPQKHAKSPELAREFLLDAATVIFKEQVEKAFREGTARQNAHSIFVCLGLKLLEERVHVACKEIITLEKQMKLLEEEETEKREEEERKERRRSKEREKKLRRKERLKGKDRDREKTCSESIQCPSGLDVSKEESSQHVDEEPHDTFSCRDTVPKTEDNTLYSPESPDFQDEELSNGDITSRMHNHSDDSPDGEMANLKDGIGSFTVEQSKYSRRRQKFRKEFQLDLPRKWPDSRRFAVVPESGAVAKSEPRYYEHFDSASRSINGLNRQSRLNASKSNIRNCSSKFHNSNNRMNDRYDFHSCSCNPNSEYRAKVEPHISALRSGRDTQCVSRSESSMDMSKQFYRGNKYIQLDYAHENFGRPKSKIIAGINSSGRDLLQPKKVWEPLESQKKYPRSNSESDITMRSSDIKVEGVEPDSNLTSSSGDSCTDCVVGDSGENNRKNNNFKESGKFSHGRDHIGLNVAKEPCFSKEAADEEHNPNMSSPSNSDNCSSCTSEGDRNTGSSNNGNLESSSTSDSEDASHQSEGRETSVCIQNGFSKCHEVGIEIKQNTNEQEACGRTSFKLSLDDAESNSYLNPPTNMPQNPNTDTSVASIGAQHQGMLPPMLNQNLQFPLFQAPSTNAYYHQNPISWPAAPANGLVPFAHPNHYVYAGPLGYGLNGNSRFCMQYGAAMHNVAAPLFNPAPLPVYQPVAKVSAVNSEYPQISKLCTGQEAVNGANSERLAVPARPHPTEAPSSFSLFHFGGPVALSTAHKSYPETLEEETVGVISAKHSADRVEGNHDCNKKENSIEEYNLFAASSGIKFSIF